MTCNIDGDIRYLQEPGAPCSDSQPWEMTTNPFERKLAANLQAGLVLDLDHQALHRVLGSTALLLDRTVTVDLALRAGGAKMRVVEISDAMLPLWADCSGNLAFALDWFRRHDEHELRLSVCADAFFWIHRRMTDPHIAY